MDIYEPAQMRRALGALGVEVVVCTLPSGDYELSEEICIERKTIPDFLNSMYSGRLGYQLQLLCTSYRNPFLLIEGRPEQYPRAVNLSSFYGYLSRLAIQSNIGLLQTPGLSSSALLISLMSRKVGSGAPRPRLKPRKGGDTQEALLHILSSFPGVGPVLSTRLLRHFRTLRALFDAEEESIADVEGIGSTKARELSRLVDTPYED
jgi:ERCC4-type nuclease